MSVFKESIIKEYKENLPTFEKISKIIKEQLEKIANELQIECSAITSRIKSLDSLSNKIELKGNKYKTVFDITDIVGARTVAFHQSEVDKIASLVLQRFEIDWENSIDKRKLYQVNQFGYVSLHYIVKIPKSMYYDEKNPLINEISSEIQIRTNLQHTWASIFHESGYKSNIEIPHDILRQFSRLAGLLELADQEFQNLHDSLGEYRRRISSVVKDGKYEDIELTLDSFSSYVLNGGFDAINNRIAKINNMEIEPVSLDVFLKVFKVLRFVTLKQVDDLVNEYSDLAYQLVVLQFADTDIDIVTSAVGPIALTVVYILTQGFGARHIKMLLDLLFGERKSNVTQANKLYKNGITLGIVKEGV